MLKFKQYTLVNNLETIGRFLNRTIIEAPKGTKFIAVNYNQITGKTITIGFSDQNEELAKFDFREYNNRYEYSDDLTDFEYLGSINPYVFTDEGKFNGTVESRHIFFKEI